MALTGVVILPVDFIGVLLRTVCSLPGFSSLVMAVRTSAVKGTTAVVVVVSGDDLFILLSILLIPRKRSGKKI